jgi:DUF917 family protein
MEEKVIKNAEDVKDLIRGLTLLGTGGGGRADLGMDYLLPHVGSGIGISLLSPETIPDDAWTCSAFGMGSIAPQKTLSAEERKSLGYGNGWWPSPLLKPSVS